MERYCTFRINAEKFYLMYHKIQDESISFNDQRVIYGSPKNYMNFIRYMVHTLHVTNRKAFGIERVNTTERYNKRGQVALKYAIVTKILLFPFIRICG